MATSSRDASSDTGRRTAPIRYSAAASPRSPIGRSVTAACTYGALAAVSGTSITAAPDVNRCARFSISPPCSTVNMAVASL